MTAVPARVALRATLLAIVLLGLAEKPAWADFLAADLSQDVVRVSSNFTGTEILLFGAIIRDPAYAFRMDDASDLIVVVRGPSERVTVHRKARQGPIWMNVESVTFERVPSFYFVASTVPLANVQSTGLLEAKEIGLAHLSLQPDTPDLTPSTRAEFTQALIHLREHASSASSIPLFTEIEDPPACRMNPREGCFFRFSGNTLFNARLPIPANVPIGKLDISVYLVRDGRIDPTVGQSWTLDVSRIGLEGWLYKHATYNPILYGLGAIMLAMAAGGLASVIFRKATA